MYVYGYLFITACLNNFGVWHVFDQLRKKTGYIFRMFVCTYTYNVQPPTQKEGCYELDVDVCMCVSVWGILALSYCGPFFFIGGPVTLRCLIAMFSKYQSSSEKVLEINGGGDTIFLYT